MDLLRKNLFEPKVVSERGQIGSVRCQGDRWKRPTLDKEAADEFRCHVLRISRGTPISKNQNFAALPKAAPQKFSALDYLGPFLSEKGLLYENSLFRCLSKVIVCFHINHHKTT